MYCCISYVFVFVLKSVVIKYVEFVMWNLMIWFVCWSWIDWLSFIYGQVKWTVTLVLAEHPYMHPYSVAYCTWSSLDWFGHLTKALVQPWIHLATSLYAYCLFDSCSSLTIHFIVEVQLIFIRSLTYINIKFNWLTLFNKEK